MPKRRLAEGVLVMGFGEMGVEAAVMFRRKFAAGAHQRRG